jgi:hypothetical protein
LSIGRTYGKWAFLTDFLQGMDGSRSCHGKTRLLHRLLREDKLNYDWMNLNLFSMTTSLHARDDYGLNDLLQEPRNNLRRVLRHMAGTKEPNPPKGVPYLMRFLLCYHSTHPADKIFALYGILKEIGISMPTPNYSLSLGEVYWTATLALLRQEPCTYLLPLASGVASKLPEVPSWVSCSSISWH